MEEFTGQCLCGAVRFAYDEGKVNWRGICHCESCRRNCAAPFTAYFGVQNGGWRWTGAEPAAFASSEGVERRFCGSCGTPMAYFAKRWGHEMHFYAATLDVPAPYHPDFHVNCAEALDWAICDDGLPHYSGTAGSAEIV